LFVNKPKSSNEQDGAFSLDIKFDLGTYIVNNVKRLNFLIGTDVDADTPYSGWAQDVKVFLISLVNTEIGEIYTRTNLTVRIQPECRCSNEFPRNENENSTSCVENREKPMNLVTRLSRMNPNAHPIAYLNDNNFQTSWISCILTLNNPIVIELDLLNGVYLLQRIEIYFNSLPPTYLIIERFNDNKWLFLQSYGVQCGDNANASCIKLPQTFDKESIVAFNIVWSLGVEADETFFKNQTLVDSVKASKIRFTLIGYYSIIQKDIRQLYYEIDEIRVQGRLCIYLNTNLLTPVSVLNNFS
jgi:usherin